MLREEVALFEAEDLARAICGEPSLDLARSGLCASAVPEGADVQSEEKTT